MNNETNRKVNIFSKIYPTSACCPKCGKTLYTSDVSGYGFVCKECDENFYTIEIRKNSADLYEINIPMSDKTFDTYLPELLSLTDEYHCNFLGHDNFSKYTDIGWQNGFPNSDTLNKFVYDLNKIFCIKTFRTWREMYDYLTVGNDLYNPATETYVFSYNNNGALCTYSINEQKAKELSEESAEYKDYWAGFLGIGGQVLCNDMYDLTGVIMHELYLQPSYDFCKDNYKLRNWITTSDYAALLKTKEDLIHE